MSHEKMTPVPNHMRHTIEGDLDSKWATRVDAACFEDGIEGEYKKEFFRIWGRVVCKFFNKRTTVTEIYFVEGEALEIFNDLYA